MERYIKAFLGAAVGIVFGTLVRNYLGLSVEWGVFVLVGGIGGAVLAWNYWK